MSLEECPRIHKLTDESPEGGGDKCPVKLTSKLHHEPVSIDNFEESPTKKEYNKLKRVMSIITGFYEKGTEMKKKQHDYMETEISKLDSDLEMVDAQRKALEEKPVYAKHRKAQEYENDLKVEHETLLKQREGLIAKKEEYFKLWEWSGVIVQVCEWLERNLDVYCRESLGMEIEEIETTEEELSPETVEIYCKGLDEITYNLAESKDFFKASVDGRLAKYHNLEKELITSQLDVIRKYPEDSDRRIHIESELLKDLSFVEDNLKVTTENARRREKMLVSHSEYLKVLEFHKKKLKLLHPEAQVTSREYDSQYDIVFSI